MSIFVSDPVPLGKIWDLTGTWNFSLNPRAVDGSNGIGYLKARIYRISPSGAAYLVTTTPGYVGSNVLSSTSFVTASWTYNVSGLSLVESERFGVEFQVDVSAWNSVSSVNVGFDGTGSYASHVVPVVTENNAAPTPTPTPARLAHGDGFSYSSTTGACAMCHRVHSSGGQELRLAAKEEDVCFTCHDGTGAGGTLLTNGRVQPQFNYAYKHDVANTLTVHTTGETVGASFGGSNRHVECEDCHDPHYAQPGNHSLGNSVGGSAITGTMGVSLTNAAPWTVPTFSTTAIGVTQEYQLCFKCHSSWAYGSSPPTSHGGGIVETDQAKEFNVNNGSYHWVEGDQTASSGYLPRTNDGRSMALVNGWTKTSKMTCSDCHGSAMASDPSGPHGSSQAYILKAPWSEWTGNGSSGDLCFRCHDYNAYALAGSTGATGFSDGTTNLHAYHVGTSGKKCQNCHSVVPHGMKLKGLLAVSSDGAPYFVSGVSGLSNVADVASGGWNKSNCSTIGTGCHN